VELAGFGFFIAALCASAAFPQDRREAPVWVAQRPAMGEYFVGIGVARRDGDLPEARAQATRLALNDIALQVEARVSSESRLLLREQVEGMKQEYRSEIRTQTAEKLEGVEIAGTYEDAQYCWVYARLSVEEFQRRRQEKTAQARQQALALLVRAEEQEPVAALALYLRALAPLQQAAGDPLYALHRGQTLALAAEIPLRIQQLLSAIHLEGPAPLPLLKQRAALDLPLEIRVRGQDRQGRACPLRGLPLRFGFVRGEGELVAAALSDEGGVARSRLRQVRAAEPVQAVEVRLDLAAFLPADCLADLASALAGLAAPALSIPLQVAPQAMCVAGAGRGEEAARLSALVREYLTGRGQALVASPAEADLVVELSAQTREGACLQGVCFSSLDLELVVRDHREGGEVYAAALRSVKGAGPDYGQAATRAGEKAGQQLEERVLPELLDHLNR
jgi:hypothetical protein